MDKKLKDIMKILNEDLNIKIDTHTIGDLTYHMISAADLSRDYNNYRVRRVLALYRIEYLYDKKKISKKERKLLFELFELNDQLESELSEVFYKKRLNEGDKELQQEEDKLINQMIRIEDILNKYHLLDDIKLDKYIANTLIVDNNDFNLEDEIKKIR